MSRLIEGGVHGYPGDSLERLSAAVELASDGVRRAGVIAGTGGPVESVRRLGGRGEHRDEHGARILLDRGAASHHPVGAEEEQHHEHCGDDVDRRHGWPPPVTCIGR
jgi:hypothetical protein